MIPGATICDRHGRRVVLPSTLDSDETVELWVHRGAPGAVQPICLLLTPAQALGLADELRHRARLIRPWPRVLVDADTATAAG